MTFITNETERVRTRRLATLTRLQRTLQASAGRAIPIAAASPTFGAGLVAAPAVTNGAYFYANDAAGLRKDSFAFLGGDWGVGNQYVAGSAGKQNIKSSGDTATPGGSVRFITMAPKFFIGLRLLPVGQPGHVYVKVNGEYVNGGQPIGTSTQAADDYAYVYVPVTFGDGSAANAAVRTIQVCYDRFGGDFQGIYCSALYPPTAAPQADGLRLLLQGDSISEQFAPAIRDAFGVTDVQSVALGGTGYVNPGPAGRLPIGAAARVADVNTYKPDVVMCGGGVNDGGVWVSNAGGTAGYRDVLSNWISAILAEKPETIIVMNGGHMPHPGFEINPGVQEIFNAKKLAAALFPKNVIFLDNMAEKWITGQGRGGSPAGDGTADFILSSDNVHPTPAGYVYLAQRWAVSLAAKLPAFIARQ